ncbi:thioesterase domain-containing protein, partial [Cytobacillus purgationiresistens]
REFLSTALPMYMLPTYYVWLDRLPLSENGKIDRKSLPDPRRGVEKAYEAPESETAQALAVIWKNLLGVERVGLHDDFFELGGQSLKAASLITHILGKWKIEVPLQWIFQHSTLESFSIKIDTLLKYGFVKKMPIVKLQDGKNTIFCFPPIAGFGIEYQKLSLYLDNYTVYGFDFIEEENRIQEYLSIMKEIQPEGPYILLGYSAGGNLAFEVAKSLEATGNKVNRLIMIDAERKEKVGSASIKQINQETAEQLAAVHHQYQEYLSIPSFLKSIENRIQQYRIYLNNVVNDGSINADIYAFRSIDSSALGWEVATKGTYDEIQSYGKHGEMLEDPYLIQNAKKIKEKLPALKKLIPENIG